MSELAPLRLKSSDSFDSRRRGLVTALVVLGAFCACAALSCLPGNASLVAFFLQRLHVDGAPRFYEYCQENPHCAGKYFPHGASQVHHELIRSYGTDCKKVRRVHSCI